MTLKKAIRSYSSAARKVARVQQQYNREALRRYKAQQKSQQIQNAIQVEADWRAYVEMLTSIHKDCSDPIDWSEILNDPEPPEPIKENKREHIAQAILDGYSPSFFAKIFGLTNKRIKKLNAQLNKAKEEDLLYYNRHMNIYATELEEFKNLKIIAGGILKKNVASYKDALEFYKPFEDIAGLGKELKFKINENYFDIELHTSPEGLIPEFEISLTRSNKISKKNMSVSRSNLLYLENIASCVMRIAKEISIYFPVDFIVITVVSKALNAAIGYQQENIILSVLTTPKAVSKINMSNIEPIETIKSFNHNLKFTKTNGFVNVPKIRLEDTFMSE